MRHKLDKLDMLRGAASAYILCGHYCDRHGKLAVFFSLGQEAVMCFFLLSGFVIYYSTQREHAREPGFAPYFLRRFRRIYPIFLLALLISYFCKYPLLPPFSFTNLLGNIFMFQDLHVMKPGVGVDVFSGNLPLWSLSYEWWFYMMFYPIWFYVPERFQLVLVSAISFLGLASYVAWPNQTSLFLLYFILWWMGLELARTYVSNRQPTFYTQRYSLGTLGAFCVLVFLATFFLMPRPAFYSAGMHPFLESRHFLDCFVLMVVALCWSKAGWKGFTALFGVFVWVAPISYALYVFHYPLANESHYLDWISSSWLRLAVGFLITILLAYLAEVPLQKALVRWTNPYIKRLGRPGTKLN